MWNIIIDFIYSIHIHIHIYIMWCVCLTFHDIHDILYDFGFTLNTKTSGGVGCLLLIQCMVDVLRKTYCCCIYYHIWLAMPLQWCQMSIVVLQITSNLTVCSTVWPDIQENIQAVLLTLCEGNPLVTSGFPSQRACYNPCHNVTMEIALSDCNFACFF